MDPPPATPSGILEITLISAQDLAPVANNMKAYAVVWLQHDSNNNNKHTTKVDQTGGTNPTWNHKFMFRVDDSFLNSEDAAIFVDIYAAAWDEDARVGYVKVLIKDVLNLPSVGGSVALHVCRPSGRSQGILNMEVAHNLKMEDKPYLGGSMVNGSVVKGNGSMVNESSICNSDVGPSASIVAAAIAKGLYKPQVHHQNNHSKEAIQIKEWTKKEREKGERWPSETPAGSMVAVPKRKPRKMRSSKGKESDGTKFFSCFGCEISVTCGEGRKKHENGSTNTYNKICNLSSVNDYRSQ